MRVLVVGAGEVGMDVAHVLTHEGHNVVIIDSDPVALAQASGRLDVLTKLGNATSALALTKAGVHDADMLIAVTSIDEVNIISCMMANRMGVETTVARIREEELIQHNGILSMADLGISMIINPEESAAAEVVRLTRRASATEVIPFAQGRVQLVGMRLGAEAPVLDQPLHEITRPGGSLVFRIMGIVRGGRTIIPHGNAVLKRNDQVFVLALAKEMSRVTRLMGKEDGQVHEVMILGGSVIGYKVAKQLAEDKSKHIKLIEPDGTRARALAEELPNVLVIHGDATDIDLLALEGIGEMDAFIAVTGDEESNLVSCLLAKHLGVKKTIALLSKGAYIPVSQTIGLDAAVNQKVSVSREVLQFLRGTHVFSVATIHGLDAEILEVQVGEKATVAGMPLKELRVPSGLLIGAVTNKRHTEIATGDTVLHPNDRVILFVLPKLVPDIDKYFGAD